MLPTTATLFAPGYHCVMEKETSNTDDLTRAKRAMRAEIFRRREGIGDDERSSLSSEILRKIRNLPEYRRSGTILAYNGFGSELETGDFLRAALEEGKTLALPRILRDEKRLELRAVENLDRDLRPGVWGILEPEERLPRLGISDVDFALVPGVAFDRGGGRLGHGGGFYDKLLGSAERLPALVAGAFEAQIVEEVPREPHDIVLDLVVTEASAYPATVYA
jgi:5-formyltetrahydrofolate cyclo-ligase